MRCRRSCSESMSAGYATHLPAGNGHASQQVGRRARTNRSVLPSVLNGCRLAMLFTRSPAAAPCPRCCCCGKG